MRQGTDVRLTLEKSHWAELVLFDCYGSRAADRRQAVTGHERPFTRGIASTFERPDGFDNGLSPAAAYVVAVASRSSRIAIQNLTSLLAKASRKRIWDGFACPTAEPLLQPLLLGLAHFESAGDGQSHQ